MAPPKSPLLDFCLRLSQHVLPADGNGFLSPLSVAGALAMLREGASGQVRAELDAMLDGDAGIAQLGALRAGEGVKLSIANAVWIADDLRLQPAFQQAVQSKFGAEAAALDFKDALQASRARINSWVASKTNGLIQELLQEGSIDASVRAVLTNAVYFKGSWTRPFDADDTIKDYPFKLLSGGTTPVALMKASKLSLRHVHRGDVQIAEFPYGPSPPKGAHDENDDRLSMLVFLPETASAEGLAAARAQLEERTFSKVVDQMFPAELHVGLPRMKFKFNVDLVKTLSELGAPHLFAGGDFSKMSQEPLTVSKVIHEAVVEVNEEGTEAAAATAVMMKRSMMVPRTTDFVVDRPFVFALWHRRSRTVLFVGQYTAPN